MVFFPARLHHMILLVWNLYNIVPVFGIIGMWR